MMMQELFPAIVYLLCFATSAACFWLLLAGWRRTRARLLLWSSLCFIALFINNLLLTVDKVFVPGGVDQVWRSGSALLGLCILMYGLIFDAE